MSLQNIFFITFSSILDLQTATKNHLVPPGCWAIILLHIIFYFLIYFCFFSNYKRKFIQKVTEVIEMNQLGCVGSRNKLQKQKKGLWSQGKGTAKAMYLAGKSGGWERQRLLFQHKALRLIWGGFKLTCYCYIHIQELSIF